MAFDETGQLQKQQRKLLRMAHAEAVKAVNAWARTNIVRVQRSPLLVIQGQPTDAEYRAFHLIEQWSRSEVNLVTVYTKISEAHNAAVQERDGYSTEYAANPPLVQYLTEWTSIYVTRYEAALRFMKRQYSELLPQENNNAKLTRVLEPHQSKTQGSRPISA